MKTQHPRPTRGRLRGFTLIELMVVVVIIAALAGMVLPRILPASNEARAKIAMGDIANITVALKLYRLHSGVYPETLDALMQPSRSATWKEPYLERAPVDPWGNPYRYVRDPAHTMGFRLWSTGPDPRSDADNITN